MGLFWIGLCILGAGFFIGFGFESGGKLIAQALVKIVDNDDKALKEKNQ